MKIKKIALLVALLMFIVSIQIPVFADNDLHEDFTEIECREEEAHVCDSLYIRNLILRPNNAYCFTADRHCSVCYAYRFSINQYHNYTVQIKENHVRDGKVGKLYIYTCTNSIYVNVPPIACNHSYDTFYPY